MVRFVVGACALAAAIAACAGDGARSVSLDEYLREVERVNAASEARIEAASRGVQDLAASTPFEDLRAAFADVYDEFRAIATDGRRDLDALDPPAEVEDQHQELLAGLEELETAFDDIRRQVNDTTTSEDLGKVVEAAGQSAALEAAQHRLAGACATLQATADAEDIRVDLNCGTNP